MKAIGSSTYSFLWTQTVRESLQQLAGVGVKRAELMATSPHLDLATDLDVWLTEVRAAMNESDVRICGLNPPGLDINLVSPDTECRTWSRYVYERVINLAGALGSSYVVIVPGRRHPLLPCPEEKARSWLNEALDTISQAAELEGVRLVLENTPSRFLDSAAELSDYVDEIGHEKIGICYDVANAAMLENPSDGMRALGDRIEVLHLSDTPRNQWKHDPIGTGDVDWSAVCESANVLEGSEIVLETIHSSNAASGISDDLRRLRKYS